LLAYGSLQVVVRVVVDTHPPRRSAGIERRATSFAVVMPERFAFHRPAGER
jgi:hypothetical protein